MKLIINQIQQKYIFSVYLLGCDFRWTIRMFWSGTHSYPVAPICIFFLWLMRIVANQNICFIHWLICYCDCIADRKWLKRHSFDLAAKMKEFLSRISIAMLASVPSNTNLISICLQFSGRENHFFQPYDTCPTKTWLLSFRDEEHCEHEWLNRGKKECIWAMKQFPFKMQLESIVARTHRQHGAGGTDKTRQIISRWIDK